VSIVGVVDKGALGVEQLIKSLMLLFVHLKKKMLKKLKCRSEGNKYFFDN
jgi:hypothetical protein